jgi:tetratricopeptide (TPR) repeat protein
MESLEQIKIAERSGPGLSEFQELVKMHPPHLVYLFSLYLNSQGFSERGISLLASAMDIKPEEWELCDKLVFLSVKTGNQTQAENKLLKAQKLFPDNPYILGSLGKLYFLESRFSQAKELLEKSIELNSQEGINYFYLALCRLSFFSEKGLEGETNSPDSSKIREELLRSKELNPELIEEDYLKGESLLTQGKYSEALEAFGECLNRYLDKKTEFTEFHKLLFRFQFEPEKFDLDDLKNHIYELEKGSKSFPSKERSNRLGILYLLFFFYLIKSSEEELKKALLLDPEFVLAQKALDGLEGKKNEIFPSINALKF